MATPRLRWRIGAAILAALAVVCSSQPARPADSAVAVVDSLTGRVALASPAGEKPVELFDWLQAGAVLQVGPGARISLTYADGHRYGLGEGTRAKIESDGPKALAGSVTELGFVPALPRSAALVNAAGTRPAATQIRGGPGQIRILFPSEESKTLPEETALRFTPANEATRYRVAVEDDTGRTVFEAETRLSSLTVPAGVLQPGARYHWSVTTVERMDGTLRASGEFSTLLEEDIRRRAVLKVALIKMGDADSLALLADVDLRLGLLLQAQEEFRAALTKAPGDAALQKASSGVEKQLAGETDQHEK